MQVPAAKIGQQAWVKSVRLLRLPRRMPHFPFAAVKIANQAPALGRRGSGDPGQKTGDKALALRRGPSLGENAGRRIKRLARQRTAVRIKRLPPRFDILLRFGVRCPERCQTRTLACLLPERSGRAYLTEK